MPLNSVSTGVHKSRSHFRHVPLLLGGRVRDDAVIEVDPHVALIGRHRP